MIEIGNRVINKNIIEILYDIQSQCHTGKLSTIEDGSDNIKITCPVHSEGHESHASCFVRKSDGVVHCFTCGFATRDFSKFVNECFNAYGDFGKN